MLQDSRHVTVDEQLRIFLQTIGLGHKNRFVQHNLQHSVETISRYFNTIMDVVCAWAPEIICSKDSLMEIPRHIIEYRGGKYDPFFKDYIGVLDETHIPTIVNKEEQIAFLS